MKRIFLVPLLLMLRVSSVFSQTFSPEQIQLDLKVFKESLETFHPELYRYQSQSDFSESFEKLSQKFQQPISQREFYQAMLPVISQVKDGHLKWIVRGQDQYYPFFEQDLFPLRLHIEEETVRVLHSFGQENVPTLLKVISIDGKPIQEIISILSDNLTFGDGWSQGGYFFQLNRYFSALYSNQFGVSKTYSVELETEGRRQILNLKGVSKAEIEKAFPVTSGPFSFEIRPQEQVGIMKIHRFFTFKGEPDFNRFLKESFQELQDQSVQKLILDLRGNEGGNEKFGIELYRYLALKPFRYYSKVSTQPNQNLEFEVHTSRIFRIANSFSKCDQGDCDFRFAPNRLFKPTQNAFQGELIVLVDGQTFSVSTEFSARVKAGQRGRFLGTETAGSAAHNSSGFFSIVTLPNSKIDLGIPRLGFHMADLPSGLDTNRGILPDEKITPSPQEVLDGYDPVLKRALELLK